MTTPTKLPIPSSNLLDSRFNFEKLDQIVNSDSSYYTDRFGKQRLTAVGLQELVNRIQSDFQNDIGLPGGYKYLGRCASYAILRQIEPGAHNQKILVTAPAENGCEVNLTLTYDETDSTSRDDGYSVFVTSNGARWKADLSLGIDIRQHENMKRDGSNFGTVLNDIITKEVIKIVNAGSILNGNTLINVPPIINNGKIVDLVADTEIKMCSLFSLVFKSNTVLKYYGTSGNAISVDNYFYYLNYNLNAWNIGLDIHQHHGCVKAENGELSIIGVSSDGSTSTASGIFLGNSAGNETNSGILNVRKFLLDNFKISGFKYGLDLTVKSTYLNTVSNFNLFSNYNGIGNSLPDVSNGGERIRFVNGVIGNNISHGIYWGAISAGIVFDSVSIDYNGGNAICMSKTGRGNRFIFTNQCWIEGWGKDFYLYSAEDSGVWAEKLHNSIFFQKGTYILPRTSSPIVEKSQSPLFYNRSNVIDYIYNDGAFIEFKGNGGSKTQSLVEIGSQNRIVYEESSVPSYPDKPLGSYKNTLNYGLYNFSGTTGNNVKGLTDSGTGLNFATISEDAALTMTYGDRDLSDPNTFTQAQDVIITSTSPTARFILINQNIQVCLNNPTDRIYGGLTINPAGITSGDLTMSLRLQFYKASDPSTQLGVIYGGDVKISTRTTTGGDNSGLISLYCYASVPSSALSGLGGGLIVKPALSLIGAVGSFKIRLPVFWN